MHIEATLNCLRCLMLGGVLILAACGESKMTSSPLVTVYKSPSCGCCSLWVEHLEKEGFEVTVTDTPNVIPFKEKFGVPRGMGSCHTAVVDGYVIEGHVPATEIWRLLSERPEATGLAVPGMPIGSPGMEQGNRRDAYQVLLFSDEESAPVPYASYPQKD